MVYRGAHKGTEPMAGRPRKHGSDRLEHRQSVNLTPGLHAALEQIAQQNQRPVAWIIRYACERLVQEHPRGLLISDLPDDQDGAE